MTAPPAADGRPPDVASIAAASLSSALLAAVSVVTCAAYCSGYAWIAGGGVDPLLSISWGASTVAPWAACWPLLRRAVRRAATDGALRWPSVLGPLGLAAVASAALERAAALAFGAEHGLPLAELAFRKLPLVIGFALAVRLYLRVTGDREQRRAPRQDIPRPVREHAVVEVVTRGGSIDVRPVDINWVRAAGNYLEIYTDATCHLVRKTLKGFASDGADRFLQIHRSVLVNRDRVTGLETQPRGRLVVRMQDGRMLPVGRGFRAGVERALGS